MKPFTEHTGRGVALRRGDVDTDQIIPAEYCKRLTKSGFGDGLFSSWRKDPDFVLNRPENTGASVMVASHNFGTGSSREHAVWALRDAGFVAVIATSFGDIFRRNAYKNGLIVVELPPSVVAGLATQCESQLGYEITVDLVACEVRVLEAAFPFTIDSRARRLLLAGLDDISVTLTQETAITDYESSRDYWLPRVRVTPAQPMTQHQADASK